MMWVMWNIVLIYLETMLVSVQDRCTVSTKHTIGLGHVESRFASFRDSVIVGAR